MRRAMTISRIPRLVVAVLVALPLLAPVVASRSAGAAPLFPPSEWVAGPHKRVVFLTFDGQTRSKYVSNVLQTLKQKHAKASFFIAGSWIRAHRKKAKLIRRRDHELGNRGFGKAPFTQLGDAELRASITRATKVLNRIGAYPRPFLRPPKGARDLRVLRIAGGLGYRSVRWTQHPHGGRAPRIARRVARQAEAGSIISLDLWRRSHRRAVGDIIAKLRRRGFGLRTIRLLENVHPVRWDVTLKAGSSGPEVAFLQKALGRATYPAGGRDGTFGANTQQGVYAFEKVHNMTRDGVVPPLEMERIITAGRPRTPKREPKNFVDVDISRQVLFEVRDRKVVHTLPISSGNEEYYTVDGETYKAHTPRGNFSLYRKIAGKRVSRLGTLYYPNYFVGGYAIHGSTSVPTYPASHGCVRIPMYVHKKFFYRNPIGTPVFVHN